MAENTEILKVTREIIDGVSRFVHSSADGRIVVVGGSDDQLPDGDGNMGYAGDVDAGSSFVPTAIE